MTLRKSKLPQIPAYLDLSDLKSNLKFYSDEEITNVKNYLTENGNIILMSMQKVKYIHYLLPYLYLTADILPLIPARSA